MSNRSLASVLAITKRETVSYFSSPVAYVFLVIFLLLTGFFTFTVGNFFERGEASLAAFFAWHPWLYLVLVPAIGMRLWSEERRSGTIWPLSGSPSQLTVSTTGKVSARPMARNSQEERNLPTIASHGLIGIVSRNSIVPERRSSDHRRMPIAGTSTR